MFYTKKQLLNYMSNEYDRGYCRGLTTAIHELSMKMKVTEALGPEQQIRAVQETIEVLTGVVEFLSSDEKEST